MYVHWHEGLFLQPHHLQAMQRRLQVDVRAARALFSPFSFGVVESRLSHDELANGIVKFERLRAIMPSGQEVFVPEEANLPSLDIKPELVRSGGGLEILLAVPLWSKDRANAFRQGESADPRIKLLYIPEEAKEVADENTGDNRQPVHFRRINARVVLKAEDLSDMDSLPLFRVVRSTGEDSGKPRLDPDYVPPSLLLRSSPTLHDLARDLTAQLNACREQHRLKLLSGGMGQEQKWAYTLRLTTLNRFCASLPAVVEEGLVTPFYMYLQLRELLGELLALNPADKLFECRDYNHLDPLPAFRELNQKIRAEIPLSRGPEPLKVIFTGSPGLMRASLDAQHFEKPSAYFLAVKTRADRTKLTLYLKDSNKFKFMPRSLEQAAIFGVELKEEDIVPSDLPMQNDVRYFRVQTASNPRRWDQIKADKAISLVWNNTELDLSDATFTLYMSLPS